MKPLILALALAAAATPALAENWQMIGQDEQNAIISLDLDSYRVEGGYRLIRTKWGFSPSYPDQDYVISLEAYDCRNRVMSTRKMTTVMKDGTRKEEAWDTDQWDSVAAGTTGETVYEKVCAEDFKP